MKIKIRVINESEAKYDTGASEAEWKRHFFKYKMSLGNRQYKGGTALSISTVYVCVLRHYITPF